MLTKTKCYRSHAIADRRVIDNAIAIHHADTVEQARADALRQLRPVIDFDRLMHGPPLEILIVTQETDDWIDGQHTVIYEG